MKQQIELLKKCPQGTLDKIEILISDNCSTDDTQDIVLSAIEEGFQCRYICNTKNLGMDGNFVGCFREAKGRYVWLLGDDDLILIDALVQIVEKLSENDYGLVHINQTKKNRSSRYIEYFEANSFAKDINVWISFISANIVRTEFVSQINFEKYMGTWFTLMPLYITAFIKTPKNLMINFPLFEDSKDHKGNGGYNFFKVFVTNFLNIWKEFVDKRMLRRSTYFTVKRKLFFNFLAWHIYDYLIRGRVSKKLKVDNAWSIIIKRYWYHWYFYLYPLIIIKILVEGKIRMYLNRN